MKKPYIPIACDLYDRLEAWATLKSQVKVIFKEVGREKEQESAIIDLQNRAGEEFLILENGLEIRLDDLISVNGIPIALSC